MESEEIIENGKAIGKKEKKRPSLLTILVLQAAVIEFTMGGVLSKLAGGSEFLSPRFILFYGGQVLVLAIYALIWQQIIKRVELSVAYVNRAMAILWSMLWAIIIFGETITWKNIVGVILVVAGTIIVNVGAYE